MKRAIFTLSMIFLITGASNAQKYFVGGNINMTTGLDITKTGGETTANQTNNSIAFGPRFGYFLSEKLAVGLGFEVGVANNKNRIDPNAIVVNRSYNLEFTPFIRYTYFELGRFSLLSESSIRIGSGGSSTTLGNNTVRGPKSFNLGVGVVPVVSFGLTEKIDLETTLDFLNLAYTFNRTTTTNAGGMSVVTSNSGLTFGVDSNDLFNVGDITVGFIYKF